MTVYTVYISFILFVLLLLLINSYFLISLKINKYRNKRIDERKVEIKENLKDIFENDLNRDFKIDKLKKSFNKKTDIEAFYLAVKEYDKETVSSKDFKDLLEKLVDIDKIYKSGVVRKEYKRSYTLYLISEFKINNEKAGRFALESLDKDSTYVRHNALKVINKNDDMELLIKAMDIINDKRHYFNEKMIIDFLDDYAGDMDELSECLYDKMDAYNSGLKKIIIAHFTNTNNSNEKIKDKMLYTLANSNEKEIIISVLRYFFKVTDERAKTLIMEMMSHKDWAIRATSVKVISNYVDENVKMRLKETLADPNYYVRVNSAISFLQLETRQTVINEILNNEDRFARNILLYVMNSNRLLSMEEYEALIEEIEQSKAMKGVETI